MKKNYKAFTIIEISIVVLIVGLVIAMVIKASSSAYEARLKSAQDLTRAAPARNIENLSLWFETTLPESIDDYQASEGQRVLTWHDINPQSFNKNDAIQSSSSSAPIFSETLANGLPALNCGTGSYYVWTSSSNPIMTIRKKFTFFVVSKSTSTAASVKSVIRHGSGTGHGGWGYKKSSGNLRFIEFYAISSPSVAGTSITGGSSTTNWEIAAGVFDGTNISLYINGTADPLTPSTATLPPTDHTAGYIVNVCGSDGWSGYVAEVIIFGEDISDDDRKEVEKYLGKKYGIAVTS